MTLPTAGFGYELLAEDGAARCGRFVTPHGSVETPAFMPVGTQATVKSQTPQEVAASGAQMILGNTYHLMLRPGAERVARLGGLHRFMAWPHAILTDSGGFQVYSLSTLRKLDDEGVVFRSHLDGGLHHLTPEGAMRIQALLGSDVAMVLDECPPGGADRATIERAVARTTRWAERSLRAPTAQGQARFGIVQGGTHVDLRLSHLETLAAMPFDGIALGGFSVGEPIEEMRRVLAEIASRMPRDKPRYLMGVGKPEDLVHAVGAGIELFDCVLPTRNARNGQALTWNGRVNVRQARNREVEAPLDARCECPVCATFSRAYLHHLIRAGEMLGARLLTQHNLSFYAALMRETRAAIRAGRYARFAKTTLQGMQDGDEVGR